MPRLDDEKHDPKFVDSQISRFGVGLFDAAFAAGSNLYIMTKRQGANEVLQVSVEFDKVVERYHEDRASAYEFPTDPRDVTGQFQGSEVQLPEGLKRFETIVQLAREEKMDSSFTTIAVTDLDPEMVNEVVGPDQSFADALGHAYHFFSTNLEASADTSIGSHQPRTRANRQRRAADNRAPTGDMAAEDVAAIAAVTNPLPACMSIYPEKPVKIAVQTPQTGDHQGGVVDVFNLPDKNLAQRLIDASKDERWFYMKIRKSQCLLHVRVRFHIIRNLETMHDCYLP